MQPSAEQLATAGPFAVAQAADTSRSAAAASPVDSSAAGSKLKVLHVDPVPMHKLAEGSFWTIADPVAKPFKGKQLPCSHHKSYSIWFGDVSSNSNALDLLWLSSQSVSVPSMPCTLCCLWPLIPVYLPPATDSMEYLLRTMFSDVPRRRIENSPRSSVAAGSSVGNTPRSQQDGTAADIVEGDSIVKCIAEKRALHVEVVLKRLRVTAAELAAAIDVINFNKLKVMVQAMVLHGAEDPSVRPSVRAVRAD